MERYLYAEMVKGGENRYQGCGPELATGYSEVVDFMNQRHEESMAIFSSLSDAELQQKMLTPGGYPITTWKWLRAMIEHEIHHRGQLYTYLGMLGVKTPPLFGLTSEEVKTK